MSDKSQLQSEAEDIIAENWIGGDADLVSAAKQVISLVLDKAITAIDNEDVISNPRARRNAMNELNKLKEAK